MCSINLLVVQVVAEEVDDFYDQPSKMISSEKEYYTIIIRDFKTKVDREDTEANFMILGRFFSLRTLKFKREKLIHFLT